MTKTILVETSNAEPAGERPQSEFNSGLASLAIATYSPMVIEHLSSAIQEVIDTVAAAVKPSATGPESCQVKFALKVSGQGNVILAKMGSELTMEVTVTWKR